MSTEEHIAQPAIVRDDGRRCSYGQAKVRPTGPNATLSKPTAPGGFRQLNDLEAVSRKVMQSARNAPGRPCCLGSLHCQPPGKTPPSESYKARAGTRWPLNPPARRHRHPKDGRSSAYLTLVAWLPLLPVPAYAQPDRSRETALLRRNQNPCGLSPPCHKVPACIGRRTLHA